MGAAAVAEEREVEGGDADGVEHAEEGVEALGAEVGVGDLGLHTHAEDEGRFRHVARKVNIMTGGLWDARLLRV